MPTTSHQDAEFAKNIVRACGPESILKAYEESLTHDASWVLKWVRSNFDPEEVFTEAELEKWAESNGFTRS